MKQNIEILAFKFESSDTNDTIKKFIASSSSCIILVYDLEKISVRYVGAGINFKKCFFKFSRIRNKKLNRFFLPVLFILDVLLMIRVFWGIFKNFRPHICWIENVYATCIVGFFKLFRCCDKIVYVAGDWLMDWAIRSPYGFIANNILYPSVDLMACRMSDMVFLAGKSLLDVRIKAYGKAAIKKEFLYSPLAFPGTSVEAVYSQENKKTMCFLGDLRLDSGIDIVLEALKDIRKKEDIILKIIGPENVNTQNFRKLAKKNGLESYVSFLGFVDASDLKNVLKDCFCGLNILTHKTSFSSYVVPGKQIYYLRFLLPIVTTNIGGILISDIKNQKLGVIIEPSSDVFCEAVLKLYKNQAIYQKNILDYMNAIKPIELEEVFKNLNL